MKHHRLQIGAFDQALEGWINTDVTPHLFLARVPGAAALLHRLGLLSNLRHQQHREGRFRKLAYLNVTRRWHFSDNSIDAIFCSHVLEHLYFDELNYCLSECQRVLIPGGIVRISVPDLERIVDQFSAENPEPFLEMMFENRTAKGAKNQHHWGFTGPYLCQLLLNAGFTSATTCSYRVGQCPDLESLDNRPEISLFVEAIKRRS